MAKSSVFMITFALLASLSVQAALGAGCDHHYIGEVGCMTCCASQGMEPDYFGSTSEECTCGQSYRYDWGDQNVIPYKDDDESDHWWSG